MVRWFFATEGRVAPLFAVIDCGVLAAVVWMPYEIIISFGMELMNLGVFLFLFAYVKLKMQNSHASWIYGSSVVWAIVLSCPPFIASLGMTYYASATPTAVEGVPYFNLSSTLSCIGVGIVVHLLAIVYRALRPKGSLDATEADATTPLLQGSIQ